MHFFFFLNLGEKGENYLILSLSDLETDLC